MVHVSWLLQSLDFVRVTPMERCVAEGRPLPDAVREAELAAGDVVEEQEMYLRPPPPAAEREPDRAGESALERVRSGCAGRCGRP